MKFLLLLTIILSPFLFSQEKIIDTIYITSKIQFIVNKSSSSVNIEDDKEFALEYTNIKENCFVDKLIINVKKYEPVSDGPSIFQLKFYANNNGMIGEEIKNTASFSKHLSGIKSDFQIIFKIHPTINISTDKPFFIGITLLKNKADKVNNKKNRLSVYSTKSKHTKMYIRRNDINFWIEDSSLKFDKLNKVLFPSINVDSKCIKK
ncbi:hypothetical protein HZQ19_09790 [Elizabethkingia anophelis]|uniref:hypothetical protein n=1 Tax=Elizabethkingia anophelis TaxID=1117645 RepID=UPI0004E2C527|nr:hypothetical protein [Elizabethkingia anophelis]KFC33229.1 hypothetical protein FF18_10990 [Elizabethkingia anophelis]MCL1035210.1 hypothetical protein [Elizabethkingia anophelis]MCT3757779.1 hypothetical protein [Elizabethkingia anophelis]MCT3786879.1 hypothetical protein [Elizabethkingia anophelis]MCT3958410.1 hypothetical protein [Elizabethkingia anophelis]